jgi:hypothetical protein
MKSLIVLALTLTSAIASAGSVDAITSIVSVGTHQGTNESGECSVIVEKVSNSSRAVMVTAQDRYNTFSKVVVDGTDYQSCMRNNCSGGKLFMQTDLEKTSNDGSSYIEKSLRTALSGTAEGKLNVIVAERVVANRDSNEESVECDIDL